MTVFHNLQECLWFCEQMAEGLRGDGVTAAELEERWQGSSVSDGRKWTRPMFIRLKEQAENVMRCNIVCGKGYRWTLEGGVADEREFMERLKALKRLMMV